MSPEDSAEISELLEVSEGPSEENAASSAQKAEPMAEEPMAVEELKERKAVNGGRDTE